MATYTELVNRVIDWSNRDGGSSGVLSYPRIKNFLEFAADEAYRTLRIPPLEYTRSYATITASQSGSNKLSIPADMIDLIQLRKIDSNSLTGYTVLGNRSDIRSFYQDDKLFYDRLDGNYFTREGNNFLVCPPIQTGEDYEIYYYRRLADIDARYAVSVANVEAGLVHSAADEATLMANVQTEEGDSTFVVDPDLQNQIFVDEDDRVGNGVGMAYLGKLAPHWLRDENQKVLLFGALAEAFDYLMEEDQSAVFRGKFMKELEKLNAENMHRMYFGGNVQTRYYSHLL